MCATISGATIARGESVQVPRRRGVLDATRPAPSPVAGLVFVPSVAWAQVAGIQAFQTASFSLTHFSAAAARVMPSLVM